MAPNNQQSLASQLEPTLSVDRLGTYRTATGFDEDKALKLYIWNAQVGEAFHLSIQGVEVGLRNCINGALCRLFGADWWQDAAFLSLIDRERTTDLNVAIRRITNRGAAVTNGQIVATLSFGFWVGLLSASYNPAIWSKELKTAFPHLPAIKRRADVSDSARRIAALRNRISHHEPIFKMNLSQEHQVIMELMGWICPVKRGWLRPNCRVQAMLRLKPR